MTNLTDLPQTHGIRFCAAAAVAATVGDIFAKLLRPILVDPVAQSRGDKANQNSKENKVNRHALDRTVRLTQTRS